MKPGKNPLNNVKEDRIVLGLLFKGTQKVSKVYDGWINFKLFYSLSVWKVNNFPF